MSFSAEVFYLNLSTATHLETNEHNTNEQSPLANDASQTPSPIHANESNTNSSTDVNFGKSQEDKIENTELQEREQTTFSGR